MYPCRADGICQEYKAIEKKRGKDSGRTKDKCMPFETAVLFGYDLKIRVIFNEQNETKTRTKSENEM